jgi:hypothetical protein
VGGEERHRANGAVRKRLVFTCREFYEMKIFQSENKNYQKNYLQEIYGIKTE